MVEINPADLLNSTDVAELLGWSRGRLFQRWKVYGSFPAPFTYVGRQRAPLWLREQIEAFQREQENSL